MNYQVFAFFMGMLGSLHCLAMCGPLMLAMPATHSSKWQMFVNSLAYQVGRTFMYGLLGLSLGFLGHSINTVAWQQTVSLFVGFLLIAIGVFSISGKQIQQIGKIQQLLVGPIVKWIGYWLYKPGGHIVVGLLNGVLPCGMVYLALAAAVNAETAQGGGIFMLLFGLGTWPVMLSASLMGALLKRRVKLTIAYWIPLVSIVMGGWFILRGAGLDIPFMSPLIYPEGAVTCK